MKCNKAGIKIHESNNNPPPSSGDDQLSFYNRIKDQNKHTGVRIEKSNNEYMADPFKGADPFKNPNGEKPLDKKTFELSSLDLDLNNYSREDLFKLFGITTQSLTPEIMKLCKQTVLKTHPDKCALPNSYFIFFGNAYKRLLSIYEFQRKNQINITIDSNYDNLDSEYRQNGQTLDKMFKENKDLKNPDNFNSWFNKQFEKMKLEEDDNNGYGEWFKSDNDLPDLSNVSKNNLNSEMDKYKKQVQSLIEYKGISDSTGGWGGCELISKDNNFTQSSLGGDSMGYTDLKQAYTQSVIPVTEDDYNKQKKYRNVEELNRERSQKIDVISQDQTMEMLYNKNKIEEEQSAAMGFYFAQQEELIKQRTNDFWSSLKKIEN